MREILFRGKSMDASGAWVYGSLVPKCIDLPVSVIILQFAETPPPMVYSCKVWTNTVGQYTGLTDKNGAKIFEGDIVNIGEHDPTVNGLYCVFYSTINHCWALKRSPEYHHFHFTFSDLNGFAEDSEVVGNIHDNPELLEGVER